MASLALPEPLVAELATHSTPTILNGLKRLGFPTERMESVDRHAIRCMAPSLGARCGFAVTRKLASRRSGPPMSPPGSISLGEADRLLLTVPKPRFLVVQNTGDFHGPMCIWGELAANMNKALGCVAGVTNGPVRDVPEMEALGWLTFANGVGVGGGHVDTYEIGGPVTIGGIRVEQGDLLHGDVHGLVKIPIDYAPKLPGAIREHEAFEQKIIELCQSDRFSLEALDALRSPPKKG